MKKIGFFLLITAVTVSNLFAQSVKWVMDDGIQQEIPVGECTWEDLQKGVFFAEMEAFYNQYDVNPVYLEALVTGMRSVLPEYTLRANVFFGAWDFDSQQLLAEFIRYQQYLRNEYQYMDFAYHLVAEDRQFASGDGLPAVSVLPTIMVSLVPKDGGQVEPVGVISKVPETSLEEDIYSMLVRYRKKIDR